MCDYAIDLGIGTPAGATALESADAYRLADLDAAALARSYTIAQYSRDGAESVRDDAWRELEDSKARYAATHRRRDLRARASLRSFGNTRRGESVSRRS